MRGPIRLATSASIALLMVSTATGSVRGWGTPSFSPTVISAYRDGPIAIGRAWTPTTLAKIDLPAGRWVVSAKLIVRATDWSSYRNPVTCSLGHYPDFHVVRADVFLLTAPPEAGDTQTLSLEQSLTLREAAGARAKLVCSRWYSEGVEGTMIKMNALQVGRLTDVVIGSGRGGTTAGAGKPIVVHGHRDTAQSLPLDGQRAKKIASLVLPTGRWWVRATVALGLHGQDAVPGDVDCRLQFDASADRGGAHLAGDQALGNLVVTTLDVTGTAADGGTPAALVCKTDISSGDPRVESVRITAVKLGTLTDVALASGVSAVAGVGAPVVVSGTRVSGQQMDAIGYVAVASLPLPVGRWLVMAKLIVKSGEFQFHVDCALSLAADFDISTVGSYGGIRTPALAVTGHATSGRPGSSAVLMCRPTLGFYSTAYIVNSIRITALRVGTLTQVGL